MAISIRASGRIEICRQRSRLKQKSVPGGAIAGSWFCSGVMAGKTTGNGFTVFIGMLDYR
jgi:hypothetical protein